LRLRVAGLTARHAVLKEVLTDEHKLYHLAFAESNANRKWDRVIFTDESKFTLKMIGEFWFTDLGDSITTRSIRLPVEAVVVCLSNVGAGSPMKGAGILHRIEDHLDGLQYWHILHYVMVPSVRMLYPDGIIHLQQHHSPIQDSRVVQEWLSRQANVELMDWPP